jgi:diacylglycerol kinase (ATP)
MNAARLHAVVNPASANGRTRKEWPRLLRLMEARLGDVSWDMTAGPGHATELAEKALQSGCTLVLSVGGDGTHQEVANAFLGPQGPRYPQAAMGILSRGTGGDLARSLGIPREPGKAIASLAEGRLASIDAGWIQYRDPAGMGRQRAFLNVASLGIGGEVDLRVNQTSKAMGGFVSFLFATMVTLLAYKGKQVRLSLDGGLWIEQSVILIAVANGQYFGGGMWVAPTARVDDGAFSVVLVKDMRLLELLPQLGKIYRGTHLAHPKVEVFEAGSVAAESRDEVWLDVDGEPLGTLPVKLHILPGALKVLVGPGFRSPVSPSSSHSRGTVVE